MSLLNPANTFKLSNPAAAIAALPALLSFRPELSIVLLSITDGELNCVLRADLDKVRGGNAALLAEDARRTGADAVIAIVVDADGAPCDMCRDENRELITDLVNALEKRDIDLLGAHIVDRVEAGGRWYCWDGCGAGGEIDDPNASPLMTEAVLTGRVVHNSRQEIINLFEISDATRAARLADLLEESSRELTEDDIPAELTGALAILAAYAETHALADDDAARLAVALRDHRIRDSLIGLGIGAKAHQAIELWTRLSQVLPDTHRDDALTMAAIASYILGDGPRAGAAAAAALRANPDHRLAGMIATALANGMPPSQIRALGETGRRIARRYAIQL